MADQINSIKGRFILSINDVPQVRDIFFNFDLQPVRTRYTSGTQGGKDVGELLVSNKSR